MIATINGLPVFDAVMEDEMCGMLRISLVDDPAVESLWKSFDRSKQVQKYAVQDEEKRLVRGVVMRADFPIYRYDEDGEYYILYKADTIRQMAEKYLAEGRQNLVNLMHQSGSDVDGVQMVQYFIKGNGVQVDGFDDIADGSLFAEFHVTNDDVWAAIKEGTYRGFSLEGIFGVRPEEYRNIKRQSKSMSKVNRLKAAIAKLLESELATEYTFGSVTTDKGVLHWGGDEDLKADDAVTIEDENGERTPAPDGDYTTADNKVVVVVDGKVAEIKDPEAEVAPEGEEETETPAEGAQLPADGTSEESGTTTPSEEENPTQGETEENNPLEARIAELEEENAALKAENDALRAQVEEMKKMSAAKPAHEEVTTSTPAPTKTGDRGLDRLARYLNAK